MYMCMKCGEASDEKAWIEQSIKSLGETGTEEDIEPLKNVDLDDPEQEAYGYDCPKCLAVCFTDDGDIKKVC